ncbi:MAG: hypothetical protein ACOC7S_01715 [Planctomycetota bacterium]
MAWRPYSNLIEGRLDNTTPGKVTGWIRFVGMEKKVRLELEGDFHRDIRGTVIRLNNPEPADRNATGDLGEKRPGSYMDGFSAIQTGSAGDITAGREPVDYVGYPYIEWYSDQNGRVVLELRPEQVRVVGEPLPAESEEPVSRKAQHRNMLGFLSGLCGREKEPEEQAAE